MDPQTLSAIRVLVMLVTSALAGRGLLSTETAATLSDPTFVASIVSLLIAIGTGIWGVYSRRPTGIIADAGKVLDGKGAVIAPAEIAYSKATPDNVVSSATQAARVPGVNP